MTKTVTALFHSEPHATAAASLLDQAGISRDAISIWSTPHNLASFLEDEGFSRADAHVYAEGVLRGGSMVIVECDEGEVDQVVRILDREGVLDLNEQQASWRSEGWEGELAASPARETAPVGSPDTPRTETETSAEDQFEEIIYGRVRIHITKPERPVRK